MADFTKAIDALRKDRESLAKKQKLVEQSLAAINSDIAAFQQEKQAALNQIDVVVSLHMHQVRAAVRAVALSHALARRRLTRRGCACLTLRADRVPGRRAPAGRPERRAGVQQLAARPPAPPNRREARLRTLDLSAPH